MKIWYFAAYDQPNGQSTRTHDFARQLAIRGHDVTVFTNSFCHFTHNFRVPPIGPFTFEEVDGVHVVWMHARPYSGNGPGRGLNMLDNARLALRATRSLQSRPDVILGPSVPSLTSWAALRVAKRLRAPFVYEVRDVWPAQLVDAGAISRWGITYAAFRHLEKRFYRLSSHIFSTLPFLEEHVIASGGDSSKLSWLPNGVNLEPFSSIPEYDGGSDDLLTVMYIGGFGIDHDVQTIIRAAHLLHRTHKNRFVFRIYGDGIEKSSCLRLAESLSLPNLFLNDPVPKSDVPPLQAQADVLVASIRDSPGFRFGINLNKVVAYLASGRPIILAGNPPNNPVQEAAAGFTVPASNAGALAEALVAMQRLGPNGRRRLGQAGRRYAHKRYDIRVLGAEMESTLKTILVDSKGQLHE